MEAGTVGAVEDAGIESYGRYVETTFETKLELGLCRGEAAGKAYCHCNENTFHNSLFLFEY